VSKGGVVAVLVEMDVVSAKLERDWEQEGGQDVKTGL
jgi:hypothetical protein